jgi:membrane protein YdbS with pleckstrin-like domain
MNDLKKKFIAILIPVKVILIWSFVVMINSFDTGETWRIVFSSAGFVIFFILTSLFGNAMIKKMKAEKQ